MSNNLNIGEDTFHLFAIPTFFEGIGRVLDIGSSLEIYNISESPLEADTNAIKHDWKAVGKDLYSAIKQQASLLNEQPA